MEDGYWTITSPTGETYRAKASQVRMDRTVDEVPDCNNPSAPPMRLIGPLCITAIVEDDD